MTISPELRDQLLVFQKNEITEHHIYKRLAGRADTPENAETLRRISDHEREHYGVWKKYTGKEVRPDWAKVWRYVLIARVLGFTFAVRLMERGEEGAQENYSKLHAEIPKAESITRDEHKHEEELLALLDEKRLAYTGSVVLGLNDALVELTGALAGLTLALRNTELIAMTGLITGVAAAMSMGASEYLSTKSEETDKHPVKASIYTGTAYLITVFVLIAPFLIFKNYMLCLALTLLGALAVIACFNYYISVAKDLSFKSRFFEMAGLSFGVAGVSFLFGWIIRAFLGVEV